ncbi:MAG: 40S ribosomal protein S19 [Candidatus Diapherotrites archaeon]
MPRERQPKGDEIMGVFDVPTRFLLEATMKDMKENNFVHPPAFVGFVKSGAQADRAPSDPDWYYARCASILYRVFKDGPIGTGSLRMYYGGRKNRGVKPHKHYKAGGKIIRLGLQQLEKAGFIMKNEKGGRIVSPKGQKYLNEMSRKAVELSTSTVKKKRIFKKGNKSDADVRDALKKGKKEGDKDTKRDDMKKKKNKEESEQG